MSWPVYRSRLEEAWTALATADESKDESKVQRFLEQHPCLLPGPFGMRGNSGHDPFLGAVITQPNLPGGVTRTPDFMWVTWNSMAVQVVLIEIETPHKKWFRENGVATAELTQAQDQLAEWAIWFKEPANELQFKQYYRLPDRLLQFKSFEIERVLIYGSALEFEANSHANPKRTFLQRPGETYMSFDRLHPEPRASEFITVRKSPYRYEAVCVPPTFCLSSGGAVELLNVSNKAEAIACSPWMSEDRKHFLIGRVPIWDEWARQQQRESRKGSRGIDMADIVEVCE
jgi:hypothetical protein